MVLTIHIICINIWNWLFVRIKLSLKFKTGRDPWGEEGRTDHFEVSKTQKKPKGGKDPMKRKLTVLAMILVVCFFCMIFLSCSGGGSSSGGGGGRGNCSPCSKNSDCNSGKCFVFSNGGSYCANNVGDVCYLKLPDGGMNIDAMSFSR
jgi:hypothetical protein